MMFTNATTTVLATQVAFDTYVISSEFALVRSGWASVAALHDFCIDDVIYELESGYLVLRPMPISIKRLGVDDFIASFDQANIAVGGESAGDARHALVAEILDTFDTLSTEARLSSESSRQLETLRAYIGRA